MKAALDLLQVARSDYGGRPRDPRVCSKMAAGYRDKPQHTQKKTAQHTQIFHAQILQSSEHRSQCYNAYLQGAFCNHQLHVNICFVPEKKRATCSKCTQLYVYKWVPVKTKYTPVTYCTVTYYPGNLVILLVASRHRNRSKLSAGVNYSGILPDIFSKKN